MTGLRAVSGIGVDAGGQALRRAFMKWQCRVRQTAMRENSGRPDGGIAPDLYLPGDSEPMGSVITLISKSPAHSVTPEMSFMASKTNDPALRRERAIQYLSATHYQKADEFADILTATFPPNSPGAARIREAQQVRLVFDAYAQVFDLSCRTWNLAPHDHLHQATIAHNRLFNPMLHPGTVVLGFQPDWEMSTSDPECR